MLQPAKTNYLGDRSQNYSSKSSQLQPFTRMLAFKNRFSIHIKVELKPSPTLGCLLWGWCWPCWNLFEMTSNNKYINTSSVYSISFHLWVVSVFVLIVIVSKETRYFFCVKLTGLDIRLKFWLFLSFW